MKGSILHNNVSDKFLEDVRTGKIKKPGIKQEVEVAKSRIRRAKNNLKKAEEPLSKPT